MRATNADGMKRRNRKLVLGLIRQGNLSRADVAKATSLTRAGVTQIVEELIATGMVEERPGFKGGMGRNPIPLALAEDSAYACGICIQRTGVEVGVVTLGGAIVAQTHFCSQDDTPERLLANAASFLMDQCGKINQPGKRFLGIGICAPGPVDVGERRILCPPHFQKWHNVPVGSIVQPYFGSACSLENVSSAFALSERYFGCAARMHSFMSLLIQEGIGSGIMLGDDLYRGYQRQGHEIGHMSIRLDGLPCGCGNIGCLEQYATTRQMLQGTPYANWREVMEHLDGNALPAELLSALSLYLSTAIVNIRNILDLEHITLAGEIQPCGQRLIRQINERVRRCAIVKSDNDKPYVSMSRLVCDARTAATVRIHALFNPNDDLWIDC